MQLNAAFLCPLALINQVKSRGGPKEFILPSKLDANVIAYQPNPKKIL